MGLVTASASQLTGCLTLAPSTPPSCPLWLCPQPQIWPLPPQDRVHSSGFLFSHNNNCSSCSCLKMSWFSWTFRAVSSSSPEMSRIFFLTSSMKDIGSTVLWTIPVATLAAMQYRRNHAHLWASLQQLSLSSSKSQAKATSSWYRKSKKCQRFFYFHLVHICVYNVSYVSCLIKYHRYVESERYNPWLSMSLLSLEKFSSESAQLNQDNQILHTLKNGLCMRCFPALTMGSS